MSAPDLYHDTRMASHPARRQVWAHVVRHLVSRWPELRGRVLELGAAYCDLINQLPAAERFAIDHWPDVRRHAAAGVTALVQDATQPFPDMLDAIIASNLLEHLTMDEVRACLDQAHRALRPGGVVVCIQPNFRIAYRSYFDDFTHRTVFTETSLADLGQSRAFEAVHIQARFLPFSMKSRLSRFGFLVPLYLRSPVKPFAGQMLVVLRKPRNRPEGPK